MARRCDLSGKDVLVGNNVSHANNKTKRRYFVNLQTTRFFSESLKKNLTFKVCVRVIKTIDKVGGIDNFLVKFPKSKMSQTAVNARADILSKQKIVVSEAS